MYSTQEYYVRYLIKSVDYHSSTCPHLLNIPLFSNFTAIQLRARRELRCNGLILIFVGLESAKSINISITTTDADEHEDVVVVVIIIVIIITARKTFPVGIVFSRVCMLLIFFCPALLHFFPINI